jgi:DnaA family protein
VVDWRNARIPSPMSAQLALNLRLRDSASFENFLAAANAEAVSYLQNAVAQLARGAAGDRIVFLAGASSSGRTHLLQAMCREAEHLGLAYVYVPLKEAAAFSPALLESAAQATLVCCDDLDAIVGRGEWEQALFGLIEQLRANGSLFVAAAARAPVQLGLGLPDLVTRLGWGPFYPLEILDDDGKLEALQLRARRAGLELPVEVARYVLARYPRDLHSLFDWLERVDRQSLASQRRLTIPFVRELDARDPSR